MPALRLCRALCAVVLCSATTFAAPSPTDDPAEIVAVYSAISPAYQRTKLPNGTYQPETYTFGEGGCTPGIQRDPTLDGVNFYAVARQITPALRAQGYVPGAGIMAGEPKLLIMVYWGATTGTDRTSGGAEYQIAQSLQPPDRAQMSPPPTGGNAAMVSDPSTSGRGAEAAILAAQRAADDSAQAQSALISQMANRQRDRQNAANAVLTGYLPELQRVKNQPSPSVRQRRDDILSEVEESRYFVILLAYDYQLLATRKERKLLWETRFSLPARRHDFGRDLGGMAQSAAHFFGQDSGGLARKPMPAVRVDLGELKSLGPVR